MTRPRANRSALTITSKCGSGFQVSAHEYNALKETVHLLCSPANAARLARSAQEVRDGLATPYELVDDDESL